MSSSAFIFLGFVILAAAWIPVFLRGFPVSLAIVSLCAGYFLFPMINPTGLSSDEIAWIRELMRIALILAVIAAGFAIDRPFKLGKWKTVWVLLGLGLPLTIALTAAAGMWLFGLSLGTAVLIAAILAPTDPVLAASVQVGPPGKGDEGELRFGLTAEAGLNDGLAFPFVALGIYLMEELPSVKGLSEWLARDLLWQTGAAALFGIVFGKSIVSINELLPDRLQIHKSESGFVAMGLTFFAYGCAEFVQLNGFVAVFATAVSIRNLVHSTDYLRRLHSFSGEVERIVTALVMAVFGGALGSGFIGQLDWRLVLFAAVALFAARSVCLIALAPLSRFDRIESLVAGYLGIRGLASLYYLFFTLAEHPTLAGVRELAPLVAFAVLASTVLYGLTGEFAMRRFGRRKQAA